jgi:tRNA pseudouridine13 synthase
MACRRKCCAATLCKKRETGGLFIAENVEEEQLRYDRAEIVPTGPIYGRKMRAAAAIASERELAVLEEQQLSEGNFAGFGRLLQGTRRPLRIWPAELQARCEGGDVHLSFTMQAGAYASVLLDEVMKTEGPSKTTPAD